MPAVVVIESLPEAALDAAADFTANHLPTILGHLQNGEDVVAVLPEAAYDHVDWRRAAVRDLARAHAPTRVNFITTGSQTAVDETIRYLASAAGVTGQYLPLQSDG